MKKPVYKNQSYSHEKKNCKKFLKTCIIRVFDIKIKIFKNVDNFYSLSLILKSLF